MPRERDKASELHPACQQAHGKFIAGTCPWCGRPVFDGEVMGSLWDEVQKCRPPSPDEAVNMRDLVARKGPLPLEDVVKYTLQVAEDLDARHGVAHRDIKPSNILVMADGQAKLSGTGPALPCDLSDGVTLDTFDYISPEQARDPREFEVRSDLYSLGCTMYYMLTGLPPFPDGTVLQKLLCHSSELPPDPRGLRADIPNEIACVTLRLMAKQPSQRYQTPKALVDDLMVLAKAGETPLGIKRWRLASVFLIVYGVVIAIGGCIGAVLTGDPRASRAKRTKAK